MNDEAYVQELLAILTNPSPTGIDPNDPYGQANDRIDPTAASAGTSE